MKDLITILKRFALPYKRYMIIAIAINLLSAVLNIFSFASIIPMLNMLFGLAETKVYHYMSWTGGDTGLVDTAINNMYYYTQLLIQGYGPNMALLAIGLFLSITTGFKTACYFGASAVMVLLRTSVAKDLRTMLYDKVLHLPCHSSMMRGAETSLHA